MSLDLRVPMAPILDAFGVPVTVTRPIPDDGPIATTAVWLSRLEETSAPGQDFSRLGPRRVLAFERTAALSNLPRHTIIVAADRLGEARKTWRVEGYAAATHPDEMRVIVVEKTDVL